MAEENDGKESIEAHTEQFYGLEVEYEDQDDENNTIEHPFDSDKIRIDQQMLSLKYIYDLIKENQIILNPEFQRYHVWKERKRKSLLIESLMLRIPIPAFYFYENENTNFIVIDGQQRLSTIREYIEGEFKLFGLEYLENQCGGKTFYELDIKYQQRIFRTQLAVNILDARSPSNVVFDIFRRVNTGGVSLKAQEIRNSIAKPNIRNLLKTLYKSEEFQTATRGRIKDERMDGQELVLRFIAFYKAYNYNDNTINYNTGDLAIFLDEALAYLNKADNSELNQIIDAFYCAMKNSYDLLREFSFRKCYLNSDHKVYSNIDIINKALFSSWAVVLANPKYKNVDFYIYSNDAIKKLADHLGGDYDYNTVLTQGTNSTRAVKYSFYKANKIIDEVLKND